MPIFVPPVTEKTEQQTSNITLFFMKPKKTVPPYIQRGIGALLLLLMGISVARLLTRFHQLEERIDQLEESEAALFTRLNQWQDATTLQQTSGERTYERHYSYHDQKSAKYPKSERYERKPADKEYKRREEHSEDSLPHTNRSNKYTEPRRININNADSLTLIRIPGIAARTASTILRFRQRYGGFYDPWQLRDFLTWEAAEAHMEEWCTQWFTADVADIRHIRVNQASVSELCRHPYISYEQAIEMVRYRTRHKRIEKLEEFSNFSTFQPDDINRLAFYLSFE